MEKALKAPELADISIEGLKNAEVFLALAKQLQSVLAAENVHIRIAKGIYPVLFASLNVETQNSQISHFRKYVDVCTETQKEGYSLKDSPVLVWKMLKKMGLKPNHDVMDKIKDHHIVEFYNANNVQTFRNLNFFSICSYTLDELLSEPWWKLYRRDDQVNRDIFYHASCMFSGEQKATFCPHVKTHLLEEINSECNFKMHVDIDYMSPLYFNDQIDHAIVIEQARLLEN